MEDCHLKNKQVRIYILKHQPFHYNYCENISIPDELPAPSRLYHRGTDWTWQV